MSHHQILNPDTLAPPVGFSHAVVAAPGKLVFLAGQAAQKKDGSIAGETMAEQFEVAARNVKEALAAAGATPQDMVAMQIFVTDVAEYHTSLKEIGPAYRNAFDAHYPAIALFGVTRLFDPEAKIELVCTAVIPD